MSGLQACVLDAKLMEATWIDRGYPEIYSKDNTDQYCKDRLRQTESLGAYQLYLPQRGQLHFRYMFFFKINYLLRI